MRNIEEFDQFINEGARPFPGAPLFGGFFFPMTLAANGQEFLNKPGGKNRSLGNILMNIAKLAANSPVLYYKLFQEMEKMNAELSPWWNENYKRMGGTMGSGKTFLKDVSSTRDETDVDFEEQLEGIDPEAFNKFQGFVSMLGDRNYIKRFLEKSKDSEGIQLEQIQILRNILFGVFMCIFKPGYLRKSEILIDNISKQIPKNPNLN